MQERGGKIPLAHGLLRVLGGLLPLLISLLFRGRSGKVSWVLIVVVVVGFFPAGLAGLGSRVMP